MQASCEDDHGEALARAVDDEAGGDLRYDGYGLRAEWVCVDGCLREARGVVLEPEEEHALEGEGFEHAGGDGEPGEDVSEAGQKAIRGCFFFGSLDAGLHGGFSEHALGKALWADAMRVRLLGWQTRRCELLLLFAQVEYLG